MDILYVKAEISLLYRGGIEEVTQQMEAAGSSSPFHIDTQ